MCATGLYIRYQRSHGTCEFMLRSNHIMHLVNAINELGSSLDPPINDWCIYATGSLAFTVDMK